MPTLLTTDSIQYYLDISDTTTANYVNVTEDTKFDPSRENSTYDPSYKDRMNQPSYVTGRTTTIDMEIDILEGATKTDPAFQEWLRTHEDDVNVATKIVRTFVSGTHLGEAKMGSFAMTLDPIDGEAGGAAKITGSLKMTSDGWTAGTFDTTTKTFTATEG